MKLKKMSIQMPKRLKDRFYKISGIAMLNQKYRWGLNLLEKYTKTHELSSREMYALGLLYDHIGMKILKMGAIQAKNLPTKKKRLLKIYLNKAETIYRRILKTDPKYFHAWYGIGRVKSLEGNVL